MLRLVSRSRARLPRTLQACLSVRLSTATSDCAAAVGVLTSIAHWRLGEAGLEKNFEFGTRPVAERFCLQALDLRVRARRDFTVAAEHAPSATVRVSVLSERGGKVAAEQVAVAAALDDIAAELQLGSRWK